MTHAIKPADLVPDAGLEGIVVADTVLSDVDGQNGELVLRGRRIEDLAGRMPFEDAVRHLWGDLVPTSGPDLKETFAQARRMATAALPAMEKAPAGIGVYNRMRLGICALPEDTGLTEAELISGALPVLLASAARLEAGDIPISPDPTLSSAEDLLRMLAGMRPLAYAVNALDRYLVTILDHGLNASTFTARVIASTRAGMRDSVIGAMGALKGPLHGGAPGPVLDMLDAVGTPDNAESWIAAEIERGERLMGFGHRVYRTRDPRADVLKNGLADLPRGDPRLALAEAVEREALSALARAKPDRKLDTNVEFYTAVLLDAVGIDRSLFTPLFATGRTPGWCAHVVEQQATGKLIRPASRYVGPAVTG
ncbi:citrate synthase/methylcitrate synthase [Roseibium aggregatum]|uniref:Citrate synthase n=1 Tax=Roseibium aggregatum TaxID=187304 RepID=A0A926P307_9HYPH|nr:citrate synthase/methylcitrate synthase [Roseibium aggregatum]MBD1549075.1 citrate synthase/methylcitrate synthase [Roseibium aggregatum]